MNQHRNHVVCPVVHFMDRALTIVRAIKRAGKGSIITMGHAGTNFHLTGVGVAPTVNFYDLGHFVLKQREVFTIVKSD